MRCAEYPLIPISYTNAGNNNYSYITNLHTNAVARPIPWAEAVHTQTLPSNLPGIVLSYNC
jgi:hypothetical protein